MSFQMKLFRFLKNWRGTEAHLVPLPLRTTCLLLDILPTMKQTFKLD